MRVLTSVVLGLLCLRGFRFLPEDRVDSMPSVSPSALDSMERYPPFVDKVWVQKLHTLTANKENLVFRVRYVKDRAFPSSLTIYLDPANKVLLNDRGIAPDNTAADMVYSAYVRCDTAALGSVLERLDDEWNRKARTILFNGHAGRFVEYREIVPFDKAAYNGYREVEVDPRLLDAEDCQTELRKEKSLFITDVAVVKDVTRTYDPVTNIGDPGGAWTFGTLMHNINNGFHPQGTRGLLKDFVRHWVYAQNVNGMTIAPRGFVMDNLIGPWLRKANNDPGLSVTLSNWEQIWDNAAEVDLRKYAPFRLSAIVNRMDVRGNSAYSPDSHGTGETRFIFSLIDPFTGAIPINPNQTAAAQQDGVGLVDWRGLNVIFEYNNVQDTRCEARDHALQWLNLSDPALEFGTPGVDNAYKVALQAITDQVTSANAAPERTNGSAIARIRTNEKVFAPFEGQGTSEEIWERQDREFRQLELDPGTHALVPVPLTNTPPHTANHVLNIDEDYSSASVPVTNADLLNWIYAGNRQRVLHGNFNLPTTLLAGSGIVRREQAQYFDFQPALFQSIGGYPADVPSIEAKMIRHQFSLNTCAGCHAGETKNVFAQVMPLDHAQEAKYWNASLDGAADIRQDESFYPGGTGPLMTNGANDGLTNDVFLNDQVVNLAANPSIRDRRFFQHISPFLLGRRYTVYNSQGTWEDDEEDNLNANDLVNYETDDSQMDGLLFVNDPSNNFGQWWFPYINDRKNGFNDLHRRMEDLCAFVNRDCSGTAVHPVVKMISLIRFVPLPEGGH